MVRRLLPYFLLAACAARPPAAPRLGHEDFWRDASLVRTAPVNGAFQVALMRVLADAPPSMQPWSAKEYRAIPLERWLATRTDAGSGEHLTVTNVRGEQLYLTRADVTRYQPVIVIGIDDERNLYRLAVTYRLAREYSWRPEVPPAMVRTVGPFLFFPDGAPPHLDDTTQAGFSLHAKSFHLSQTDPLTATRTLSPELQAVLTGPDGCLKCHALRGTGARAHHVRAADGIASGGFALPLEEYSADVLRRFLFQQDEVAKAFDVTPIEVRSPELIFELVQSGSASTQGARPSAR